MNRRYLLGREIVGKNLQLSLLQGIWDLIAAKRCRLGLRTPLERPVGGNLTLKRREIETKHHLSLFSERSDLYSARLNLTSIELFLAGSKVEDCGKQRLQCKTGVFCAKPKL